MTRGTVLAMALALAAGVATADDKARPRDGSSSSGRGSDAGARHHDSAPSQSSSSASDGGSTAPSSSGGPSDATPAQRRHPRAGTGTGYRYSDGGPYYPYYGYYPYDTFYFFGYPRYVYGELYSSDPYFAGLGHGYGYHDTGSLRILVDPEKTKVYVDGYYAGLVDDFDGMFQRLHIAPGRHAIALKLEGYRTQVFRVYVPVGHTLKLRHEMVRGAGEDTEDLLGQPDVMARPDGDTRMEDDPGRLRLDVRPLDASIYLDGVFRGTSRDVEALRVPPGRHRLEIVRPGYRTEERDVEVRPGETTELRADLERLSQGFDPRAGRPSVAGSPPEATAAGGAL
jgi:PEGA domain